MVKTYLGFYRKDTFGQIVSNSSNIVISKNKRYIYTACNNYLLCFDLKTGEQVAKIFDQAIKITSLAICNVYIAVGYENGSIALISLAADTIAFSNKTFFNHKSAITELSFNSSCTWLWSGSYDTNLFIYDLIGDSTLYKLTGHKDNIIKAEFYSVNEEYVISLGKDNSFKIWNINNQLCIYTHVDMVNKITQYLCIDNLVIFASFDEKMKLFLIENELTKTNTTGWMSNKGVLNRQAKSKVILMEKGIDDKLFYVLSADNSIEFFKILSVKEIKNRLISSMQSKDKNDKKEKWIKMEKFSSFITKAKELMKTKEYNYNAKFRSLFKFEDTSNTEKSSKKSKNTSWKIFSALIIDDHHFLTASNMNSLNIYYYSTDMLSNNIYQLDIEESTIIEIGLDSDNLVVKKEFSVSSYGHREAIRYIKFSNLSENFITISNDSVKLWSIKTGNSLKTIKIKNGTSATFVNKDRLVIVSNRQGDIIILDTTSFEILGEEKKAHTEAIWNLLSYQIKRSVYKVISASTDKKIKYWNLIITEDTGVVELSPDTELNIVDSITYVLLSPDHKYLTYSLMDSSIKIIYSDTQKFFLTLYGHKMPVNCFDISSDNTLLVSGSADKNVKIWGMDFGDCHKSFFAHNDIITCVKFVNKTHYFFTASKDRCIKYYDGDWFEMIMEFANNEFYDCIWWWDINKEATQMVAVSSDFSIKLYQISDEQKVAKISNDERIERIMNEEAQKDIDKKDSLINPLNKDIEMLVPIKKRMDNIGYAEDLIESIQIAEKFKDEVYQYEISEKEYNESMKIVASNNKEKMGNVKIYNFNKEDRPTPSPLMWGKNIFEYILYKIQGIRYSELESTLNNIPYTYFQSWLFYFEYFIRNNIEVEWIGRCVIFFSVLYQIQISNDKTILRYLLSIKKHLKSRLKMTEDVLCFNIKGIEMIIRGFKKFSKDKEEYEKNTMKFDFNP